jgi:hypothetical protein
MSERWTGWAVDLIRDGVAPKALKAEGEKAVWKALVTTAVSAMNRGVDRIEWIALIDEPGSHLGTQARLTRGTKPRTSTEYRRTLERAWAAGRDWLATRPAAFGPVEIIARIRAVRERIEHPDAELTDVERAVLRYACDFAESRMTDRPALSRRGVMAATGLSERVARDALDRMADVGLLVLEVRGRPGATSNRANCYRLPGPDRIPVPASGSMGRSAQIYGTSEVDEVGTREQVYGTSRRVRLTIEADDADSLEDLLQRLSGTGRVVAMEADPPANVIPLRGRYAS